ncbi:hypothetical protein MKX01_018846 [Papaver californicum]|nr:hypothetical protein MKX01_018846 [Papaver californicum]
MEEIRVSVEEETYISVLRLCEWKRGVEEGNRVYSRITKSMTHLSIRLGNGLLSMFVRFDNLLDAWFVFGKMSERDIFSWNVILGGYAKSGFFDETLNLYHRMLWVGIQPDVYTFPCVLRTCGGIQDLSRGKEIHVHVVRFGFESHIDVINALITMYVKCGDVCSARLLFDKMRLKDRISWNAMISGYFENEEFLEGLNLFLMMQSLEIQPDLMTMTSVISASELLGDEKLGSAIHGYVIKTVFSADVSVNNSLVQMHCSVGNLVEAENLFCRMKVKDVVSWTAMICGYEKNDLANKAVESYKQMVVEGVIPDEIMIASVLSACSSLGLVDTERNISHTGKTFTVSYTFTTLGPFGLR